MTGAINQVDQKAPPLRTLVRGEVLHLLFTQLIEQGDGTVNENIKYNNVVGICSVVQPECHF